MTTGSINKRKQREHPLFDYTYEDDITFECPVRGTVTQKVIIKRYKSQVQVAREAAILRHSDELEELLESDGYHIEEVDGEE